MYKICGKNNEKYRCSTKKAKRNSTLYKVKDNKRRQKISYENSGTFLLHDTKNRLIYSKYYTLLQKNSKNI